MAPLSWLILEVTTVAGSHYGGTANQHGQKCPCNFASHASCWREVRAHVGTQVRWHAYAGKHAREYACMRGIQNAIKHTLQILQPKTWKNTWIGSSPETDWRQNASRCHFQIQVSFRFAWQVVEQYIKPNSTTRMRNTFQSSSFHAFQVLQLKTRKNTQIRSFQA